MSQWAALYQDTTSVVPKSAGKARTLAPEGRISTTLSENRRFSAACLAPEGGLFHEFIPCAGIGKWSYLRLPTIAEIPLFESHADNYRSPVHNLTMNLGESSRPKLFTAHFQGCTRVIPTRCTPPIFIFKTLQVINSATGRERCKGVSRSRCCKVE